MAVFDRLVMDLNVPVRSSLNRSGLININIKTVVLFGNLAPTVLGSFSDAQLDAFYN